MAERPGRAIERQEYARGIKYERMRGGMRRAAGTGRQPLRGGR